MKPSLLMIVAAAAMLSACMPIQQDGAALPGKAADMHNSRNSLDWAAAYEGVLPCASCPGIETRLTLNRDGSYELLTRYIDRQPAPTAVRGQFSWQPSGNAISLDAKGGGQQFAVGEGRLSSLSLDGSPVALGGPNRVLSLLPGVAGAALQPMLETHRWTLVSATDAKGQRIDALFPSPGRPLVFGFANGRVDIEGGCNRMNSGFQVDAERQLKVGRFATTMMACEAPLMNADAAVSALLAEPVRIDVLGVTPPPPRLRWVSPAGQTLVFSGQATPESLYGAATRVFLEVNAQRVACQNPLNGQATCLQVRERRFDAQGLVVLPHGEWRPLFEAIDGYTHQPGVRNVLRLKQFQRGAVAAGTPASVYVLDLVVESETVKP
jgi:uncharacterized lipoprotein NlpE involved in copper resistance/heat shock protein HslJ